MDNFCPICGSSSTVTFLVRKSIPVHQNLVMLDRDSAINIPRGDLMLAFCEECGFIFNKSFEPSLLNYGPSYENTQTYSPLFLQYVDDLVNSLIYEGGVRNSHIFEVGCGNGYFLRKLIEKEEAGNIGYGFDPSYAGKLVDLGGRLRFKKSYFGAECLENPADVVLCRHVIEHVPDPVRLLNTINSAIASSVQARAFFETPCVDWILRNGVLWDFFYEHCSYFTVNSLTTAFEISGFKVNNAKHVFGGQYLWLEATASGINSKVSKSAGDTPILARKFGKMESDLKLSLKTKFEEFATKGGVAIWGAGAKGVTLVNLIDSQCELVSCVIDINPRKQGYFVPGTGHPIINPRELNNYNIKSIVFTNPNYRDEIMALSHELGMDINIIDLMEIIRNEDSY